MKYNNQTKNSFEGVSLCSTTKHICFPRALSPHASLSLPGCRRGRAAWWKWWLLDPWTRRYYRQSLWIIQEGCVVHTSTSFHLLTRTAQVIRPLFSGGRGCPDMAVRNSRLWISWSGDGWPLTSGKSTVLLLMTINEHDDGYCICIEAFSR